MHNLTLLYAEDDIETRENYSFVLKSIFDQIYTAGDGKEALLLYKEKKPDIILLDISMPFLNGLELIKIIRQSDVDTPIAIVTAHSEQSKLLQAIPLGLTEYLLKPIDDKVLLTTIQKMLKNINYKNILPLKNSCEWKKKNLELFYKNTQIKLTKNEIKLMSLLIDSIGNYISKEILISHIWYEEYVHNNYDNKLIQLIYRLNKKITLVSEIQTLFIQNGYSLGYKLLPK